MSEIRRANDGSWHFVKCKCKKEETYPPVQYGWICTQCGTSNGPLALKCQNSMNCHPLTVTTTSDD